MRHAAPHSAYPAGPPRRKATVLAGLLGLSMAAAAVADDPKPGLTVMVPMADGTRLATDVYLPDQGGPAWPVRLVRTPYGRTRYNHEYGAKTDEGYAMVLQDLRGRFDSEGEDLAFVDCGWGARRDGVDTLKWILKQPWCNGKIGTEGASAMGITQCMLAPAEPPGLLAQYVLVAAPSLYHHGAYTGGALRASLNVGWLTANAFDPANVWMIVEHPFYDVHWAAVDSIARAEDIGVPAVHFGGWYDVFCQGTIDAFVSRQHRGGPGARGTQKLIMGPWAHGGPNGRPVGEVRFPRNAQQVPHGCGAKVWFDHWLKGEDNGIERVPAVQYYTMGAIGENDAPGNAWRSAGDWPVPARETAYYLHADGGLSLEAPSADAGGAAYDYHPSNPVPTRGGCLLVMPAGPFDQRDLERRDDVLTFTTEPLDEPVEVTGRVRAVLSVRSDRVDTDFAVKLTDVYPDGRSMNVVDGIARCRYRKGFDRLALLTPGEPAAIEVDLWSTSIIFNKGHRIRVAVTSSNYPRFDVNVNTGWPGWPMGPALPAHNEVLCGGGHASRIILPIVGDESGG